jgi:hypothetical protein
MPGILNNPGALLAICLVAILVVGINATLFTALRRSLSGDSEIRRWRQALGGALASQRRQDAQMDDLHRAVSQLPAAPKPEESARE